MEDVGTKLTAKRRSLGMAIMKIVSTEDSNIPLLSKIVIQLQVMSLIIAVIDLIGGSNAK